MKPRRLQRATRSSMETDWVALLSDIARQTWRQSVAWSTLWVHRLALAVRRNLRSGRRLSGQLSGAFFGGEYRRDAHVTDGGVAVLRGGGVTLVGGEDEPSECLDFVARAGFAGE